MFTVLSFRIHFAGSSISVTVKLFCKHSSGDAIAISDSGITSGVWWTDFQKKVWLEGNILKDISDITKDWFYGNQLVISYKNRKKNKFVIYINKFPNNSHSISHKFFIIIDSYNNQFCSQFWLTHFVKAKKIKCQNITIVKFKILLLSSSN